MHRTEWWDINGDMLWWKGGWNINGTDGWPLICAWVRGRRWMGWDTISAGVLRLQIK
ncbi:MAG: hypothetical protein ACJ8BW_35310 [Ktedonobacteraceae bacterium]